MNLDKLIILPLKIGLISLITFNGCKKSFESSVISTSEILKIDVEQVKQKGATLNNKKKTINDNVAKSNSTVIIPTTFCYDPFNRL